jgi:methionine--tRNA ligase beta chain
LANYSNLIRWFDHIQHLCRPYSKLETVTFANQTLLLPLSFKSDSSSSSSSSSVHAIKKTEKADKESKPSSESNAGNVETPKTKKDQEPKKKEDKKEKPVEKPVEKTAAEELDPSKLDIRVGVIVTCQAHPEAEKLLVESIDVGEESPRTICSGLKAFYRPEEMVGRLVLVLANLKDRTMVGVKSQGMVLCSCNADHSDVKLLDIPASAKPGDRVKFKGFDSEPASSSVVAKKKILESIAPFLNTNNDGVCGFKDIPFTINDVIITAPIKNGVVS